MNKTNLFIEVLGWFGLLCGLGSYAAVSTGLLNSEQIPYHLMVITGSIGLGLISYIKKAWQPFWMNLTLFIFGIWALIRLL